MKTLKNILLEDPFRFSGMIFIVISNGTIKTINQLNRRWNSMCGKENFYLVNVNTAREADLQQVAESLL